MNSNERRKAERVAYICEVQCEGSGISRLSTRINDLSTTGVFIDSMTCYAVGTVLQLKFYVRDVLIEVRGEVRYGMPQIGMGIKFLDLKPDHLALIESFVEKKPTPDVVATDIPLADIQPAASPHSQSQKALVGNFAIVSLFDVIQIIENSRLTGSLSIASPAATGNIYFNEGQIVGGESGSDTGLNAINKFLGTTEGVFEFSRSGQKYERAIESTSNTSLLLDLLCLQDEKESASPSF